jgi:hypothetical protein
LQKAFDKGELNMELIPESTDLMDYLKELDVVNFSHPLIQKKINELFHEGQSEMEKAKIAFEFVRDEISHSWDIQSTRVTHVKLLRFFTIKKEFVMPKPTY